MNEKEIEKLLYEHDIKLQELSIRLDHIENNLNRLMNKYSLYWDIIDDKNR